MKPRVQSLSIVLCLFLVGGLALWIQYGEVFMEKGRKDLVSLEDYYFETSIPTVNGERQLVVSLVAGSVDFIVLIHGNNRGFPKYVGGKMGNERATGRIYVTSPDERIELTGTAKAYQISNGKVERVAFAHPLSSFQIPNLLEALEGTFTLERLKAAIREI